jgi:hypothetical protein
MPTLKHHITDPVTATKGISGLLNELSHNEFVAGLAEEPAFELNEVKKWDGLFRCIECGTVQEDNNKFVKLFQRGEGICRSCWYHED